MRKIITVLALVGVLLGLTGSGTAGAVAPRPVAKSICETAGRDNATYWRVCMTRGTVLDAARLWYSAPVGVKGRETRDGWNRRSVCEFAREYGGIRPAVRELFFDMAHDAYHRHLYVLAMTGEFAAHDCRAMGYRV